MSSELVEFLSEFSFFENEKTLVTHIENYLARTHLIRPLLVYSAPKKGERLNLEQCRLILNSPERLQLYAKDLLIEHFLMRSDLKKTKYLEECIDGVYYYYLNLGSKRSQFFFSLFSCTTPIDQETLQAISNFSHSHMQIGEKFDHLYKTQELIHIDDVTGLYNQRKLYKDLAILVEKFNREKDPFSVLFIDIDHFKQVNDGHGHLVGTKLLEAVATDIKSLLRDSDISYRYGGDEFVVILVNSDAQAGKIVGERILNTIKNKPYIVELQNSNSSHQLSVSIGVAEFPTDAVNAQEILSIADRMMYEAKESGRGVVFNTQDVFRTSLKKIINEKKL